MALPNGARSLGKTSLSDARVASALLGRWGLATREGVGVESSKRCPVVRCRGVDTSDVVPSCKPGSLSIPTPLEFNRPVSVLSLVNVIDRQGYRYSRRIVQERVRDDSVLMPLIVGDGLVRWCVGVDTGAA